MAKSEKIQLYANRAFLSVEESAEYLNVSKEYIYEMLQDGTLECRIKGKSGTGGHNAIFFSSILDYVERLKSPEFTSDKYFRKQHPAKEMPDKKTLSKINDRMERAVQKLIAMNK